MHPLDDPARTSLFGLQAALAEGGGLARRYQRDVNLFAAARDDSPEALAALADLLQPGDTAVLVHAQPPSVPPGLQLVKTATCVQMVATRRLQPDPTLRLQPLGEADAQDMLALAQLTEPGPFMPGTHRMGRFLGLRVMGRLAAMAGERFRAPGFVEVSGVCTHPDFRARGLARALSATVAARIQAQGDTPFLHAYTSNETAIALYSALGFELRALVQVMVLQRAG